MRMENNKLPVKAYNPKRSGYKVKGRPRVRWIDNIKVILKKHGYSAAMATHLALERSCEATNILIAKLNFSDQKL
jgi:hypothetical protein